MTVIKAFREWAEYDNAMAEWWRAEGRANKLLYGSRHNGTPVLTTKKPRYMENRFNDISKGLE